MKALILMVLALLAGCTNEDHASRALSGAGYTKVTYTGYEVFGCGEDDTYATGFTATGPGGQRVSGVVCSGIFKGATIRTK